MSDNCPKCAQRAHVYNIQMQGRKAADEGLTRDQNPYTDEVEKQYWEYGWIEENFMEELEEHRAVMQYAGDALFIFCEELDKMVEQGTVSSRASDQMKGSLSTIMKSLAEKLQGR